MQGIPETDEDCLIYYSKKWNNYRWSSKILHHVSSYLNAHMAKRSNDAYTVEEMAFQIWSEHVFNHLNEKVSNAALEMLECNRNGEIVNTCAIKDVIQSYIELGILDKKERIDTKDADELRVMLQHIFHNRFFEFSLE